MCQRYPGALPETGGVLDQDYKLMVDMAMVDNVYSAVSRLRSLKGHDIHSLSSPERRILDMVRKMGLL